MIWPSAFVLLTVASIWADADNRREVSKMDWIALIPAPIRSRAIQVPGENNDVDRSSVIKSPRMIIKSEPKGKRETVEDISSVMTNGLEIGNARLPMIQISSISSTQKADADLEDSTARKIRVPVVPVIQRSLTSSSVVDD
ncbi:uncharacterized protein LOC131954935 [Physella acuta]|uniref:uncharacterized protein LOC131954935 n=1 Tax=Physella acuta TaxID=109671 RepID=UPI0027DDCDFC|nr:uncharacterized protein LOC131954935 [Physella acuta]